jgi:hypothetical protein
VIYEYGEMVEWYRRGESSWFLHQSTLANLPAVI